MLSGSPLHVSTTLSHLLYVFLESSLPHCPPLMWWTSTHTQAKCARLFCHFSWEGQPRRGRYPGYTQGRPQGQAGSKCHSSRSPGCPLELTTVYPTSLHLNNSSEWGGREGSAIKSTAALPENLVPTCWLTAVCHSSSRGPNAFFWPPRTQECTWCTDIHACKTPVCSGTCVSPHFLYEKGQ